MPALADEFALPDVAAPVPSANLLDEFDAPPPRLTEDLTLDATKKAVEWERAWKDAKSPGEGLALIGKWLGSDAADAAAKELNARDWEELNKPKVAVPRLNVPSMEDTPESMRPMQKAASVIAGTYNAVAGVAESLTTPFNIGTLGAFGALQKAAQGTGAAARAAQWALAAIKTGFGAEMAKSAGGQAGEASVTLADPDAPLQEKVEAGLSPVITGGLAIISAAHGGKDVADLTLPTKVKVAPKEVAVEVPPEKPIAAENVERVDIGPRDETFSTGDGVATPKEQAMLAEQKRLVDEYLAETTGKPPNVASEFTAPPASEVLAVPEAIKEGGATPEPLEAKTTSTKNAIVDQERVARGLPPAMEEAAREFPEVWDEAMRRVQENPEVAENLVADLKVKARPLADVEDAILLRRQIELQNEFAEVSRRIAEKRGTPEELAADVLEQTQIANDLLDVYNVGKAAGTETARGLNARKMLADENFTLGQMVTLRRAMRGGAELTPDEMAATEKLQAKIDELQTKFDAYRARASELLMSDAPPRRSVGGRVMAALSEQAVAARARIKARLTEGRVSSGLDPTELADYAIIGAEHIAKGIVKAAEWGEVMVKELGEQIRPHLAAIRTKADEMIDEGGRTEAFKKRATTKIEDLERRTAEGDFSKRERRPVVLDEAARKIQAQLEAAKDDYYKALEKDQYDRLSATEKVWKQALRGYDLQRVIQTTGELSFILRQGAFSAASAPITTARAIPDAIRALFADPITARAIDLQTFNHPDFRAARQAGTHFLEAGERLSKREELYGADLVEKIPVLRHFNQANRVFLNKLRLDLFRDMRNTREGLTPEQDKAIGKFVNESTGRGGLGRAEGLAVPLGRILYAPRFLMSRLQMAVGHSMWGGDRMTRQVIAKRYARFLVGAGAYYYAMSQLAGDEKNKVTIEWNPKSSDFGKVKVGDTRLDPLGGLAQVIVFGARMATGETKNARGQTRKAGQVPIAARFARTKLAPIPGSIVDLYTGTDLAGDPTSLESEAWDFVRPMSYQDIYEALKESEDLSDETAFTLLSLLGQGLQTYDANERRKRPVKPNPANKP